MRPQSRGFTLLELLVTIGMIAVLMALLLPTLAMAREHARRATCASNLRQQGAAFHAYSMDHNGELPTPVTPSYRGDWPFGAMVVNYGANPDEPAGQPLLYTTGYVRDPRIFYCPSAESNWVSMAADWNPGHWTDTYVGYPCWAAYRSAQDFNNALAGAVADRASDSGNRLLASDLITRARSAGQPVLGPQNHLRLGGAQPAGGFLLFNDGSVIWSDISDTKFRFSMTGDGVYFIDFYF